MISYNITTGDTLTKVFQRIPGGLQKIVQVSQTHFKRYRQWIHHLKKQTNPETFPVSMFCPVLQSAPVTSSRSATLWSCWQRSCSRCRCLFIETSRGSGRWGQLLCSCICRLAGGCRVVPAEKHPRVSPGVLPVHGADVLHSHRCDHQSGDAWAPNVWINILQIPNKLFFPTSNASEGFHKIWLCWTLFSAI